MSAKDVMNLLNQVQDEYNDEPIVLELKEEKTTEPAFNEVLGLETRIESVAKVIKAVANDKDVLLKLEGYINYDETVMDVRRITFLVDITEGETLKKLQEAFPEKKENTTTNTTNNSTQNFSSGTSMEGTTNATSSYDNLYNTLFGTSDISSLFANFFTNSNLNEVYTQNLNNTSFNNFSSIFGSDTSDFFASFNSLSQNQSSLLNSGNLENFNFEEFQTAFESMSNNMPNLQSEANNSMSNNMSNLQSGTNNSTETENQQ
jgi:hypothetical protein